MRYALPLLCAVLVFCCTSYGEDEFKSLPDFLYEGTYILEWSDSKYLHSGLGTGIDLSKYGYNGRRAILTVCHVVSSGDGKAKDIQVSVLHNGKREIFEAKLVAYDEDRDLALLEANRDLPAVNKLAEKDRLRRGSVLFTVIYPEKTAPTPVKGELTTKSPDYNYVWQGSMQTRFGYSGGTVWDPNNKEVVGVVVSVLLEGERREAFNICFFAPIPVIDKFLQDNSKKIKEMK